MIDLCWQPLWTFVREYPAGFTAVAFNLFWFFRFLVGHRLHVITCWNKSPAVRPLWRRYDLHDWQRAESIFKDRSNRRRGSTLSKQHYCARCHLQRFVYYPADGREYEEPQVETYDDAPTSPPVV